jgi:hypothetical protein
MHASISRVIRRSVLAGLVSFSLASAGGCFLVAAGAVGAAGGVAYTEGRERRVYAVRIDDAWPAVKAAVDQLGIEVTSETRTQGSGEIAGRWGEHGDSVRINAKSVGSGSTMIAVRVGLADQSKNLEIQRRIESNMPADTPPSTPYD